MKLSDRVFSVLIVGLLVVLFALIIGDRVTAQKKRTQFEYQVRIGTMWLPAKRSDTAVINGIDPKKELDEFGNDGWELVAIEPASEVNNGHVIYVFRRPK